MTSVNKIGSPEAMIGAFIFGPDYISPIPKWVYPNFVVSRLILLKPFRKISVTLQMNIEVKWIYFSPILVVFCFISHALKLLDRLFHYFVELWSPPENYMQNLV